MARKRMIHRDIWESYEIKQCNFRQRLLFIGLITIADDEGRLKADSGILKGNLFPFDNFSSKTIETDLQFLDSINLIHYYSNGTTSNKYVEIITWKKYQKVDHPVESNIPIFENDSRINRENFSTNSNSNSNSNSNTKAKTIYADFVSMLPEEYQKLINQYGEINTKKFIDRLNAYKGSNGKKYKSDYLAILNWVVDAVLGTDKKKELEDKYRLGVQKEKEWESVKEKRSDDIPEVIKNQIDKVLNKSISQI